MFVTATCLFLFSRLSCWRRRHSGEVSKQFFLVSVIQEALWLDTCSFSTSSTTRPNADAHKKERSFPGVATCWSMTSFKRTLVVLLIHLRWHVRFADTAHSLKFREVLTCNKKKTNCISFLAGAGEFWLVCSSLFFFFGLFGLHRLR